MNTAFFELAIVLGLASILGYFIKTLKLPLVIAYLGTGVLLSLLRVIDPAHSLPLTFLPDFGLAFVLFFIGMELDLREIKSLGVPIITAGLTQIIIATFLGFSLAGLLGFSRTDSVYLGVGLAFSSTIVIIKMLIERKDLTSLYGKLSLGVCLLEDLVAITLLMFLSVEGVVTHFGVQQSLPLLLLVGKGLLLYLLSLVFSRYLLNIIFERVGDSAELLFLTALTWCFASIVLAQYLGFSLMIGAFLSGIALASSPYHYQIQSKVKPLRDFFVTLFFVYLGAQIQFNHLYRTLPLILMYVAYACLIKPVLFLLLFGSFGFRKHTIFRAAINLSQISEFSLVIALVGLRVGVISADVLSVMALTGVLSIIFSSIMISSSKEIYKILAPIIGFFVRSKLNQTEDINHKEHHLDSHVVVIGAHRVGGKIVEYLKRESISQIVLDFNPKIVQDLLDRGIPAIYGDIADPEIMEILKLEKSKLIVSTSQDKDDNLYLLSEARHKKLAAAIVVRATNSQEAKELYKAGADYVILPEIVSGDFFTQMLRTHWPHTNYFKTRASVELKKLTGDHLAFE